MPWRCPACDTQIHHGQHDDRPRLGFVYRCHVCRLELTLDPLTNRLAVTPVTGDNSDRRSSGTE